MNRASQGIYASSLSRDTVGHGSVSDDPRLVAALEDFLSRLNAGDPPSRDEFLGEYPEIADELADCLDGLEFIHTAASRISSSDPGYGETDTMRPPAQLGDYRLQREVGRGGMGIVYEAEQISLGRRVALKVLPFAAAIDPRQRQRFQVEAQAAAHLHHPHIVPIYSVGCDRGVHFYAMQFIEGHNLSSLIRELGNPATAAESAPKSPANSPYTISTVDLANRPAIEALPVSGESAEAAPTRADVAPPRGRAFFRTVARLGAQAADALEHAHGLGVLHRDVKPSNLIVDPCGNLWVTDFGLARFEEDAGLTRTGDLLGTLRYMSPEQAQATCVVVDHRTDVYSLGATLYEFLTLRPVFDGRDRNELLRQIAFDDPITPRKINPEIPRDLETIVLKSMAKEPQGRYANAREMADDLRRFLADEPIKARRPSVQERTARWARRHKPALAVSASLLVVALIVGAALLWLDQRRTLAHQQELMSRRERANNFLRNALPFFSDTTRDVYARVSQGDYDPKLLSLFMKGMQFFEQVVRDCGDDPEVRTTKAEALEYGGSFQMLARNFGNSEGALKQAIAIREAMRAERPTDPEPCKALASTLKLMGELQFRAHGSKAGAPHYGRAIELQKDLVQHQRNEPEYLVALIESQTEWAHNLEREKNADAAKIRAEVAAEYSAQADRVKNNPGLRNAVLQAYFNLALSMDEKSQHVMEKSQHVMDENSQRGTLIPSDADLADIAAWRRDAQQAFQQGLVVAPNDPMAHNNLAWALVKYKDASKEDTQKAVALAQEAVRLNSKGQAFWNTLGACQYRAGNWKEAHKALEKSMALAANGGEAEDLFLQAMTYFREDNQKEAMKWYAKAMELAQNKIAKDADLRRLKEEAKELLDPQSARKSPGTVVVGPTASASPRYVVCPYTGLLIPVAPVNFKPAKPAPAARASH
jgi:serine/threonine protein kinase